MSTASTASIASDRKWSDTLWELNDLSKFHDRHRILCFGMICSTGQIHEVLARMQDDSEEHMQPYLPDIDTLRFLQADMHDGKGLITNLGGPAEWQLANHINQKFRDLDPSHAQTEIHEFLKSHGNFLACLNIFEPLADLREALRKPKWEIFKATSTLPYIGLPDHEVNEQMCIGPRGAPNSFEYIRVGCDTNGDLAFRHRDSRERFELPKTSIPPNYKHLTDVEWNFALSEKTKVVEHECNEMLELCEEVESLLRGCASRIKVLEDRAEVAKAVLGTDFGDCNATDHESWLKAVSKKLSMICGSRRVATEYCEAVLLCRKWKEIADLSAIRKVLDKIQKELHPWSPAM